jgi:hypothetical protein
LIVCLNLFYFGFKNTKTREYANGSMKNCNKLGFAYYNEADKIKKYNSKVFKIHTKSLLA